MSRTIRMIGLDLDGTLLNSEKQLTAYTRDVLKKAIEQEVAIVVATGCRSRRWFMKICFQWRVPKKL